MARVSAVLMLLVLALAAHAEARGVLQAAPAKTPAKAPDCKPVIQKPKRALCIAQYGRKVVTDPKSAAVIVPTDLSSIVTNADGACAVLSPGTLAVPETLKFTAAAVDCFNGRTTVKGIAFTEIGCCPLGSSLATWRTTRAQGGQIDGSFARIRGDVYSGPQIEGNFARARDSNFARARETAAESGESIGSSTFFGH